MKSFMVRTGVNSEHFRLDFNFQDLIFKYSPLLFLYEKWVFHVRRNSFAKNIHTKMAFITCNNFLFFWNAWRAAENCQHWTNARNSRKEVGPTSGHCSQSGSSAVFYKSKGTLTGHSLIGKGQNQESAQWANKSYKGVEMNSKSRNRAA